VGAVDIGEIEKCMSTSARAIEDANKKVGTSVELHACISGEEEYPLL